MFVNKTGAYSGLYYKHITIVSDDSSIVNKWRVFCSDNIRVIIYDCNVFKIQATGVPDLALHTNIGLGWNGVQGTNIISFRTFINYIRKKFYNIWPKLKRLK
jgi:hypothetical protein